MLFVIYVPYIILLAIYTFIHFPCLTCILLLKSYKMIFIKSFVTHNFCPFFGKTETVHL